MSKARLLNNSFKIFDVNGARDNLVCNDIYETGLGGRIITYNPIREQSHV